MSTNLPILAEDAAHASLGASSAARWMACPGSINLIAGLPQRDGDASSDNIAARTGRCAHALAEFCLVNGAATFELIGTEFHGVAVTEEMAQHVQLYVNHVRKVMAIPGIQYWIERKFSLASLNPPMPMFGTADFSAYDAATRTLFVDDLKYGMGLVEIEGNPQTKYYALGVWLSLPHEDVVERIQMTIVQPRKDHPDGVVRSITIDAAELSEFAIELLDAARATLDPNAPLHAGDHCKFCPAKARCPELHRLSQEIAATEFDAMPVAQPPAPASLTPQQLAQTLALLPILDDWSAAVKQHAEELLRAGEPVEGFKLVERRAERTWTREGQAQNAILSAVPYELSPEVIRESKLKSPAQIEKLLGKKVFKEKLEWFTTKKSSGLKLVPEDHPSPPVLFGGTEFDTLPAPSSENEGKDNEKNEQ